jgi:hypothetical protein
MFFTYAQTNTKQINIFFYFNLYVSRDRATSQAVSRRPLNAGAQVQYLTSQGLLVVDKVAMDRSFSGWFHFPLSVSSDQCFTHIHSPAAKAV